MVKQRPLCPSISGGKNKSPSRYAEQCGRYAEQLVAELLHMATTVVAMRSSQPFFTVLIGRYVHTSIDLNQAERICSGFSSAPTHGGSHEH